MSVANTIVIIEIYDSGVRVSDGERVLADSVSCALIESETSILVGTPAEQQAHLRPRESSTSFWSRLADSSDTKYSISNAEIALHHLESVWRSANCTNENTILITPSILDKHDLGLVLGICKKLSINVAGMVCNATLAMQQPSQGCQAVYLDLLQHNIAITTILQSDSGVSLAQPSRIINYGLTTFMQNCAQAIAKKFTSETRFDPLHSADNEQQFFDKLPLWLTMLNENNSIECKLSSGGKDFSIQINDAYLETANKKLLEEIAAHLNILFHDNELIAIYCSPSCKNVYGLQEFLFRLPGCAIVQLDELDLVSQTLACRDEILTGDQIHFVNALSWHHEPEVNNLDFSTGRLSNLSNTPTHILINGHAYGIKQDIFLAKNETGKEPRIVLKEANDNLCKIFTNKLSVEVHVNNGKHVKLNQQAIESVIAAKIGDILSIPDCDTNCFFIKVISNEA